MWISTRLRTAFHQAIHSLSTRTNVRFTGFPTGDSQATSGTIGSAQTGGNRSGQANAPHTRRIDMTNDTRDDTTTSTRPARLLPAPATWEDMLALGLDPVTGEPLDGEEDNDGA